MLEKPLTVAENKKPKSELLHQIDKAAKRRSLNDYTQHWGYQHHSRVLRRPCLGQSRGFNRPQCA